MRSSIEGRLLIANWCLVAAAALGLLTSLTMTNFVVALSDPFGYFMIFLASMLGAFSLILLCQGSARWPNLSHAATVLSQLLFATMLSGPLVYIAASANYPFQDKNLYAIDHFLGLEWRSWLYVVNEYKLGAISKFFYRTILGQPLLIPIALCLTGHVVRCYQFVFAILIAVAITGIISIFLPATGTYTFLGLTPADYPNLHPSDDFGHISDLLLLRSGELRMLNLADFKGIVTFPSFHTAAAVLYLWALWAIKWLRPIVVVCNGGLILATPMDGGHYFVDVFAGILLAILCIWAVRAMVRAFERDLAATLAIPASVVARPRI